MMIIVFGYSGRTTVRVVSTYSRPSTCMYDVRKRCLHLFKFVFNAVK